LSCRYACCQQGPVAVVVAAVAVAAAAVVVAAVAAAAERERMGGNAAGQRWRTGVRLETEMRTGLGIGGAVAAIAAAVCEVGLTGNEVRWVGWRRYP
jgi:hypothetical protein